MVHIDDVLRNEEVIYVFGYGSLTWKPDFESDNQFVGYVNGYERRFWQGSVYHRGSPEKPGRVLTLTKVPNAQCWGLVFEVRGSEKIAKCLDALCLREQSLGCYEVAMVPVYIKQEPYGGEDSNGGEGADMEPIHAIVYHALPGNELFLGKSSEKEIAYDIATCHGQAGHNLEYLLRLTDFLREHAPDEKDNHVFGVERRVRQMLGLCNQNILPWHTLLGLNDFRQRVAGEASFQDDMLILEDEDSLDSAEEDVLKESEDDDSLFVSDEDLMSSEDELASSDDELLSSEDEYLVNSDDERTIESSLSILAVSC